MVIDFLPQNRMIFAAMESEKRLKVSESIKGLFFTYHRYPHCPTCEAMMDGGEELE